MIGVNMSATVTAFSINRFQRLSRPLVSSAPNRRPRTSPPPTLLRDSSPARPLASRVLPAGGASAKHTCTTPREPDRRVAMAGDDPAITRWTFEVTQLTSAPFPLFYHHYH
jgi:hypothetical protein